MKYMRKLPGDLCYLSPINVDDYVLYTEWLNDLETIEHLELSTRMITLEGERDALREISKEHNYAIVDQRTDQLIGNCGIANWDPVHGTAEVGIFIGNSDYRGRGYGSEALYLLVSFAFSYLNIKSIMLRVYGDNERAVGCYEKIGFRTFGRWRSAVEQHGRRIDLIYMDCLPGDLRKPPHMDS